MSSRDEASVSDQHQSRHPRLMALLNVHAGEADHAGVARVKARLTAIFAALDVEADLVFCSGDELEPLAEKALAKAKAGKIDAVVVGGGDGSIRAVAGVLANSGVPLGVLPLGTLNHFAKDLGIPTDLEAAAAILAAGEVRSIDLAEVNGESFINNSSIGIYPYIVVDRERRRRKHKLAKWIAMIPAFFRLLRHFPRRRLAICTEDWSRPYRTPCLFIGNNDYGMEFFTLGRRERLDRGELSVHVVKQRHLFGFFWMICRMCFGHVSRERDLESFRLHDFEVRAKVSRLPVALDGEVEIMHPPLHYRSRPAALRVIAPAAAWEV
jgi:diacylglycerol kinase family enzyme